MKRYIFAAILALLSLSSCVVEEGYTPDKDNSARVLYNEAKDILHQYAIVYTEHIIYADALLRGDAEVADIIKSEFFDNCHSEILADGVKTTHSTGGYVIVKTGGKSLAEGGEWQLFFNDDTQASYTCTGIVGQEQCFAVNRSHGGESVDVLVSYKPTEDNDIFISISGEGHQTTDRYALDFSINEDTPLVYRPRNLYKPIMGTMYIDFLDKNTGKKYSAAATALLHETEFEKR